MGTLKPGATYIYEQVDGVTYAREHGTDPKDRFPIGWEVDAKKELKKYHNDVLWSNILKEAETNSALQQAVERVILLYKLSVSKYD